MSQQSEAAEATYARLSKDCVSLASIVRDLRTQWGDAHEVASVHRFAQEVAACLLHKIDVEVGDIRNGIFELWPLDPWDVADLIEKDLMSMSVFYENEGNFVFRKKA